MKIQKAIDVLNNGGIVIFPTDTAFGIGCRIDRPETIKRLFEIRKRPENKATPVLVNCLEMAEEYTVDISKDIREKLIAKYWPGGLTIILRCKTEKVPSLVRGGGNTLGLRMPDHDSTLQLLAGIGVPLLAPSANFAGDTTPYEYSSIDKKLLQLVDYSLPGKTKESGSASTVIDCTVKPWKIVRQGAVVVKEKE